MRRTIWTLFFLVNCAGVTLGQNLYITEFVAVRTLEALDDDGDPADFVEIFNAGVTDVDLGGYFLSDDCTDRFKWSFPDGAVIHAGDFRVVWATEKNRTDPLLPLHASFRLAGDGECVILTDPFGDQIDGYLFYPNQQLGYSYGLAMNANAFSLVEPDAPCEAHIPPASPSSTDLSWTERIFNDSSWSSGTTGIGYDDTPDYLPLIGLDVGAMKNSNASCYVRIPFQIDDPAEVTHLTMEMKYDDGYIAYINGTRVTSRAAPDPAQVTSTSLATADSNEQFASEFERSAFDEGAPTLVAGENILAIHALNHIPGSSDLVVLPRLKGGSFGDLQTNTVHYFPQPTPGSGNVVGLPSISEKPNFSEPSGAYPAGLSVELFMDVPVGGTEIRYTLDQTVPDENSPRYTGAIDVVGEVVIAARAFQPGLLPSKPIFNYYVILGPDVLNFSSSVPIVVCSTLGQNIPLVCSSGPYTEGRFLMFKPAEDGRARLSNVAHLEHFAGYRRRGNPGVGCLREKFYFNIEFRDRESKDDDEQLFDDFAFHSDYAMFPPWNIDRAFMRNPLAYWMSREIGRWAPFTEYVECFLHTPGQQELTMSSYWGAYVLSERIERGVGRLDINRLDPGDNELPDLSGGYILQRDRTKVGDTSITAGGFGNIVFAYPQDPSSAQLNYFRNTLNTAVGSLHSGIADQEDSDLIDVGAWRDYHIMNFYPKEVDAFIFSAYMYKPRNGPIVAGPLWDYDRSMGAADDGRVADPLGWDAGGTGMFVTSYSWYGRLFDNEVPLGASRWARSYRARWFELRSGPLSTQNINAKIDEWAALLGEVAARNLQRWPQNPPRFGSYQGEVNHLKTWLSTRANWIDTQFEEEILIEEPEFSHSGGNVSSGFQVEISTLQDGGEIYYTVNGPDPLAFGLVPHAEAILYLDPIIITENIRIRARTRAEEGWSDMVEIGYFTEAAPLVVTEVMFDPAAHPSDEYGALLYEFIEFHNPSSDPISLEGVVLDQPFFDFSTRSSVTTLNPGEYIVVARFLPAFVERYGDELPLVGQFSGALSSSQDVLVTGAAGEVLMDFFYQSSWEPSANGDGSSLVIRSATESPDTWNNASSWRASLEAGGSPGREDTVIETGGSRVQGDVNGSATLEITDVVSLLFNLVGQITITPCATAEGNLALQDVDGDGSLTVNDAVYLLRYLFLAGPPPDAGSECAPIQGCTFACG